MRIEHSAPAFVQGEHRHRLLFRMAVLLFVAIFSSALPAGQPSAVAGPAELMPSDWAAIQALLPENYLKASNTAPDDRFGYAVAISGNTLVVGAPGEDSSATGIDGDQNDNSAGSAGAVFVFVKQAGNWVQQAYLKASNAGAGDQFGSSVAIDGETLVVGAIGEAGQSNGDNSDQNDNSAPGAGAVYVFVRSGETWSQQAYLKASNAEADDRFGFAVAISGQILVVSADGEDSSATVSTGDQADNSATDAGAVYVFTHSGNAWNQQAYLKAPNANALDHFGHSLGVVEGNLYKDMLVVGAPGESSSATGVNGDQSDNSRAQAGAAYVFTRSASTWELEAYLKASNTDALDRFGSAVGIANDTIVVGAPGESSSATGVNGDQAGNDQSDAGAAYVFLRSEEIWSQQAYLKASNTGASDGFGSSVAAILDGAVVGAPGEDSSATGIDGDGSDNSAENAGAAYFFTRSDITWSQSNYLKAANSGPADSFAGAGSVAISRGTIVVGAAGEASQAGSVDGDGSDNSAPSAGAGYTFYLGLATTRWSNPTGGDWTTDTNWQPASVPGNSVESLFNLNATYPVNVGTRRSGRSRVEAGSVTFQSAHLTLNGPFAVGGTASFTLPGGRITASDLTIGHLIPVDAHSQPAAQAQIVGSGTLFTVTDQIVVGQVGSGSLFVSQGQLHSNGATIGKGAPGTVTLDGADARWTSASLLVGTDFTGTLVLQNNATLLAETLTINPSGRLLGQGAVQTDQAAIAGEVSPGVGLPLGRSGAIQPASLIITGSVEMSNTARLVVDIHGVDNHDRLVIAGPAKVGGQLVLNFGEGFAPSQGDVLSLAQASSFTGNFAQVVIDGLVEGFQYQVDVADGVVTLTALNDGVATTEKSAMALFLPLLAHGW